MNTGNEPLLANLLGYSAGTLVFGIFIVLLLKDSAGRRLRSTSLTLTAAVMALLWNAGALLLMTRDSQILLIVTTSALSLLPALLLDLLLDGRLRPVAWSGYALSSIAIVLHASERMLSGEDLHRRTLQATAIGFALLTAASLFALHKHGAGTRRAAAAMALILFALSFSHLHGRDLEHAWAAELAIHHAGVPVALFVLMQDYRFLLLDAFLRFLANILLAALFTWGAAEGAHRMGWINYQRLPVTQVAFMAMGTCALLVIFAVARGAVQRLLTRLVLRRGDADILLDRLRKKPIASEAGYLEWAGAEIARFFEAERTFEAPQLDRRLPFDLGRRAGGRPYLSEDLALLASLETEVNVRIEQYREGELKRLVSQAELRALQSQIHPHFLFNALNALYGTIPKEAASARRTVLNLADIFRYFLQAERLTIPLEEEIEIVRAYLEIECVRLGSKLHTDIRIDPAARRIQIPVLSIQPLVENAVRHGIAPLVEGGTVVVKAAVENGQVAVRVSDTGPGFSQNAAAGHGVGLENVRQRLRLCYGDSSIIDVERSGGETVVSFRAPVK